MSANSRLPLKLISGCAHPELGAALARELNVPVATAEVGAFADGEMRAHITHNVRGADVFLLQPTGPPVNDNLMQLALLIDAAKAAGAARVTALTPYLGYARQEQRSRRGDPRSAQVVAKLLGAVGLDHLVVLDLHTPALESAFPMPVTLLHAEELFLPRVKSWQRNDLVVVAPDAGCLKRAQRYALALNVPLVAIAKERPRPDAAAPLQVLGEARDRTCLIVDDLVSTGRTLAGAADSLRQGGARDVFAIFTHPVMGSGAVERLFAAHISKAMTTDSIPVTGDSWLEVVSIAPLLARAVRELRETSSAPEPP